MCFEIIATDITLKLMTVVYFCISSNQYFNNFGIETIVKSVNKLDRIQLEF